MGGNKKKKSKGKSNKIEKLEHEAEENVNDVNELGNESKDNAEYVEKETTKRPHDDDSDLESEKPKKPKKKKKKLSETSGEPTSKKNKKSIRQMKKEKFAQRQAEAQAVAKDQLKSQCLNYLSQWKHDKQNWKFMKAKQVWLYKNKFSTQLVPDTTWPVLLEYFESTTGNIKNMLLDDAHKIIKQMDEWTEANQNKEDAADDETTDVTKPDENVYNRARSLIQCLT